MNLIKIEETKLSKILIHNGIIFSLIIFLWPISLIFSPKIEGTLVEQFDIIKLNLISYQITFIIASLIAPSISILMIIYALFIKTKKNTPLLNILGFLLLCPYIFFVSLAYTSQFTFFISLLHNNDVATKHWYFGNFDSFIYYINQLGYLFFAFSGMCIGYKYLFEIGIRKIFGILLESCSILSIVAFIGLILKNEKVNSFTMFSGLLTLPFGIISIIIGKNLIKK